MEPVTVRELAPDTWQSYRTIRLAALADSPSAFSSTLARELALSEERWRHRLLGRGQFVAHEAGTAVGLAPEFRTPRHWGHRKKTAVTITHRAGLPARS